MFNDWLIQQLKDKDWSQADLHRASGLTSAAISKYINGRTPDEDSLRKIAHAFKLPVELVFEKAGLLPPKPELSPIKRKLIHVAESEELADSDVELAITLLEQRLELYKRNPKAKPAQ